MHLLFVIYADYECTITPIDTCQPDPNKSSTEKTAEHNPSGYSYIVVGMNGEKHGPFHYMGEIAVHFFLAYLQDVKQRICEHLKEKLVEMTHIDWAVYKATDCQTVTCSLSIML